MRRAPADTTYKEDTLTDLSNIKHVIIVDGLGRKMETINATGLTFTITDDTLRITHDGDSMYSTGGTQRWLS